MANSSMIPEGKEIPDGSLVMLSAANPYSEAQKQAAAAEDAAQRQALSEVTVLAIRLERRARVVRLLALFDMIFSMMHAMTDTWAASFAAIMSYCGYLGASTFRRDLTGVYLFYLILFAFTRISLSIRAPPLCNEAITHTATTLFTS